MRLHIFSDLHLEFAPFVPAKVEADAVIIAGDVHPGIKGLEWVRENFRDIPVLYVMGNHEFYRESIPQLTADFKRLARGTNIHVLENTRVEINDVTFLGATLWTDFALFGDSQAGIAEAAFQMSDYRRIRKAPDNSPLKPQDSMRMHMASRLWLAEQLRSDGDGKTVVITHHAPSGRSLPPHSMTRPLNPAYASDLESLVAASNAALWVHGHIHHCSNYQIGATRVLANPRGYPEECLREFDPGLVVEI